MTSQMTRSAADSASPTRGRWVNIPVLVGVTVVAAFLSPITAVYGAIIGAILLVTGLVLRASGSSAGPVVTAVGLGMVLGSLVYFGAWALGAQVAGGA